MFIPDGSRGPIQIDSAGHLFDCCPKTTNLTSNLIWAGNGVIPSLRSPTVTAVLDGVDYGSQGHAFLFLHSNNGIVFDLDAIRKAIPGWTITRFIAVAGNVAPRETALADVWVFIDGQARFRRFQIGGHNGGYSITLPTKPGDRFLSLIVTDGGNGLEGDWIIFGDPRLELMCPSDLNTVALPNQREL